MSRWLSLPPDSLQLTRIVKFNIYMYSGQTWLFLIQSNSWNTIQSVNQTADGKLNFLFTRPTTQLSEYKIHDLAYLKIKCCDIFTQLFKLFQREFKCTEFSFRNWRWKYSIDSSPKLSPLQNIYRTYLSFLNIILIYIIRIARILLNTEFFENPNDGGSIPPPGETACVYTDFVIVRKDKSFRVPPPKKKSSIPRLFFSPWETGEKESFVGSRQLRALVLIELANHTFLEPK